jgi:hypothetical protein
VAAVLAAPLTSNATPSDLGAVPEAARLLDVSRVSPDLSFQYATNLSETHLLGWTTEPDSVFLAAAGLILLGGGMLFRWLGPRQR